MKIRLSDVEYNKVLACIESIHRCRSLETFPNDILALLRKIIPCEIVGYNEVNLSRQRLVVVLDPPSKVPPLLLKSFETWMHQHPVINYFDSSGDGQALKISDFLTTREFHQLPLYNDFFRQIMVEDQISFGVRVDPGFIIGIAINRRQRSFTEKDRQILNLLRPHIIQAYVHVAEVAGYKEHQHDLQGALQKSGVGVIALNTTGEVLHATPGAMDCLSCYIPIPETDPLQMPESLLQWALFKHGKGAAAPYVVSRDLARLSIRRVPSKDRILLLLSEDTGLAEADQLDRYRLTPREREVLKWVAQGKSNPEIAAILGLAVGNVKLRVERILVKMGVENRTGAALLARGTV